MPCNAIAYTQTKQLLPWDLIMTKRYAQLHHLSAEPHLIRLKGALRTPVLMISYRKSSVLT